MPPQHDEQTLAAAITPPGEGGIGVINVVGRRAVEIVEALFQPARGVRLNQSPPGRLLYGRIIDEGRALDEAIVTICPTNESLTGEPTVEINCHGGIAAVRAVLASIVTRGAVKAEWHELLARAAVTGSLDAIQAEAIEALPSAFSPLAAQMLIDQWNGSLSRAITAIALQLQAGDARQGTSALSALLQTSDFGFALVRPRRAVIVGAPNAGKSTLFNAIVGHQRVIVAEVPGTTRDAVAETIILDGIPLELTDTAGLRDTDHVVEVESVKGTWRRIAEADTVIMLFDGSREATPDGWAIFEDIDASCIVPAINKCELPQVIDPDEVSRRCNCTPCLISALEGTRLDELEARLIADIRHSSYSPGDAIVFTARQRNALRDALALQPAEAAEMLESSVKGTKPGENRQ